MLDKEGLNLRAYGFKEVETWWRQEISNRLMVSSRFSGKFLKCEESLQNVQEEYWLRLEWLEGHMVLNRVDMMLRKWEFKGFCKFHRCFRGRFLNDDCFLVTQTWRKHHVE